MDQEGYPPPVRSKMVTWQSGQVEILLIFLADVTASLVVHLLLQEAYWIRIQFWLCSGINKGHILDILPSIDKGGGSVCSLNLTGSFGPLKSMSY